MDKEFEEKCQKQVNSIRDEIESIVQRENESDDYGELDNYLEDALDMKYLVDSNKTYNSVKILVVCGGPTIYIDTESQCVELYWSSAEVKAYLSDEAIEAIDDWALEAYNNC